MVLIITGKIIPPTYVWSWTWSYLGIFFDIGLYHQGIFIFIKSHQEVDTKMNVSREHSAKSGRWPRPISSTSPQRTMQHLWISGQKLLQYWVPSKRAPSKILNHLSKTMHSAARPRKKGKTLSLPLHAHSKHMGRRKVLLGQGIF